MLSRLLYLGLAASGLTALRRRWSRGGLILCYHNVVDAHTPPTGDPATHLAADKFEEQMRWLRAHYDVVPLGELVERLGRGNATHTAAITFDDAYGGVFLHATPILRALELPATVFVVTDASDRLCGFWWDHPSCARSTQHRERLLVTLRGDQQAILPDERFPALIVPTKAQRPASWEAIREAAAAGFDIGSHSCAHRTLTQLDDGELRDEVWRSREMIAQQVGKAPDWFAYPYGIQDRRVRDAVAHAGYRGAVGLELGLNPSTADPFALHRVNVPASISLPALGAWAVGLRPASELVPA